MSLALKLFFLPGNLAADGLGATRPDDRAMIRTLVDMLFWNLVLVIGAYLTFR